MTTVLVAISDSSEERESGKPFRNENTRILRCYYLAGENSINVPRVQKCSCALHDNVNGSQSVSWSRLFHIKLDT